MEQLSSQAQKVIDQYLNLKIGEKNITTPYFNNRRKNIRGALRVLIGKGSPEDIAEEATIFSLREKIKLAELNAEQIKKFLIEHNLGIDCSGLIYHVLDTELKARNLGGLKKYIHRPWIKNPIRKLISQFRSAENTGVSTFNNNINSKEINLKDIQPGDLIVMMGAGPKQDYNHVLLVSSVIPSRNEVEDTRKGGSLSNSSNNVNSNTTFNTQKRDSSPSGFGIVIEYTHSFQYPTDGLYNHGVRQETITITDPNKNLLEQNWSEPQMQEYAKKAKEIFIRRLKALV